MKHRSFPVGEREGDRGHGSTPCSAGVSQLDRVSEEGVAAE